MGLGKREGGGREGTNLPARDEVLDVGKQEFAASSGGKLYADTLEGEGRVQAEPYNLRARGEDGQRGRRSGRQGRKGKRRGQINLILGQLAAASAKQDWNEENEVANKQTQQCREHYISAHESK